MIQTQSKRRRAYRKKKSKYYKRKGRAGLARTIKRVMLNSCETKHVYLNICTNQTMEHNELTILHNNLLYTTQGDTHTTREGDTIYCRGVKIKMYIENQQYRPYANQDR